MEEPTHEHDGLPDDFDWNDIYTGSAADYMPPDALTLELTESLPVGDVLDVGCGAGGLLVALAARGWRPSGVDVAGKAVAAARAVCAARGVKATLVVGDASTWRPSRTYDLVTNTFALPLTREAQVGAYCAIREAVAPGGTVILKDFDTGMAKVGPFGGCDLIEVAHLREAFEGFDIQRAEIVATPAHDHGAGGYGEARWTAALLVARRPG
ncbi:MAG: class I SAM-dependent methyltransferase [Sandaracinaceae bacterium]